MIVSEGDDRALYDRVQEQNLIRQYDFLTACIEIGLIQGHTALDKYTLWALNHIAVANISQFGGRFRQEPIYVGNHLPPHFKEVPDLMDRFISTIHENWFNWSATDLAAYGLWRLNWIHPFIEVTEERLGLPVTICCASKPEIYCPGSELCRNAYEMTATVTSMDSRLPTALGMKAIWTSQSLKPTWLGCSKRNCATKINRPPQSN